MSDTQLIKSKIDIVDFVSEYVDLKPAGKNHKALCPFHNESTPSFMVNRDRQMWHCFGCNEGGDIFTFVEKMEGMKFIEALKFLADRAGVELSQDFKNKANTSQKNRIKEVNKEAARFFHNFLLQMDSAQEAREYLEQRGLSQDTIDDWQIGYIPDQWRLLTNYLMKKGYGIEDLVKAGLSKKKKSGQGYYDWFRGRVMFPIRNVHGTVAGFTGRLLKEKENTGKYINTPDTPVYDKSEVVFGLYKSKSEIRKKDNIILVEGQMDVIACHQAGTENVVAVSGTSLNEKQINLLKRYSKNLTVAFDNDDAGIKAARRGIRMAMRQGMHVKVIEIPEGAGEDPDECLQNNPDAWFQAVEDSREIMDWYFEKAFKDRSLDNPKDKQKIADDLLPEIKSISYAVERDHWLQKLSDEIGVEQSVLREDMKRFDNKNRRNNKPKKQEQQSSKKKDKSRFVKLLQSFLGLLLRFPNSEFEFPFDLPEEKKNKDTFSLFAKAKGMKKQGKIDLDNLRSVFENDDSKENIVDVVIMSSEMEFDDISEDKAEEELENMSEQLEKIWIKKRRKELEQKIQQAEKNNNEEKLQSLLQEVQSLKNK